MFSICIPVYNVEKYLAQCVDSVLNQTYQNFEVILVDDGSVDESFRLCQEYVQKDSRIKAFTKKNEGQLATRLFAINKAKGDIVLCLDSDDYLDLNTLEELNVYFENEECDVVYFRWRRVADGKIIASDNRKIEKDSFLIDKAAIYLKVVSDNYYNSMCLKAFRKKLAPKEEYTEFHKARFAEDLIQTLGILKLANGVLFSSHVFYNYRINPASVSQSISINSYENDESVRSYVCDFLLRENVFSKDDWNVYGIYCALLLFNGIMTVCNLRGSFSKKIDLLNEKRENCYYVDFVSKYKTDSFVKDYVLVLFSRKLFLPLIFLCNQFNRFIRLKKIVKNIGA